MRRFRFASRSVEPTGTVASFDFDELLSAMEGHCDAGGQLVEGIRARKLPDGRVQFYCYTI